MKKLNVFILAVVLTITFAQPVMSAPIYLNQINTGIESTFVNGHNYITAKDAYILLGQVPSDEEYLNFNIPLRSIIDHKGYFACWDKAGIYLNTSKPAINRQIIGYSYQQRPIEAVYMTPPDYTQTILTTFTLHGFEDQYPNDGQLLTQVAEQLIKNYSDQPELLRFTRVIVIPCVNPDGVYAGVSNNGFGRCNAQKIDLNRDFNFNWEYIDNPRYQTGGQAFTTPEAQALRDLVINEKPDIVLDFHGWLDCCYSPDLELKNSITSILDLGKEKPALPGYKPMQGYFSGWASQHAKAALVEYRFTDNTNKITDQTMQLVNQLIQN